MFRVEAALSPGERRSVGSRTAAIVFFTLTLAGCANEPSRRAAVNPAIVAAAAVEIEDDGLPAQTPPSRDRQHGRDDAGEPFSRNYGGANPSAPQPVAATPVGEVSAGAALPPDLPRPFRRQALGIDGDFELIAGQIAVRATRAKKRDG